MSWILVIVVSAIGIHGVTMNTVQGFKSRADCDRAAAFAEIAIKHDYDAHAYCIITDLEPK